MISTDNYFEIIKGIKPHTLPADLKMGFDFVQEATEDHTTWKYCMADPEMKATVAKYMADLSDYLETEGKPKPGKAEAEWLAKDLIRTYVLRGDSYSDLKASWLGRSDNKGSASIRGDKIEVSAVAGSKVKYSFPLRQLYEELALKRDAATATHPKTKAAKPAAGRRTAAKPAGEKPAKAPRENPKAVERVPEAITFIKRYALLHNKEKTEGQILNFINSLQRAILEKRIRKTDPYAHEIAYMQDSLVKLYNGMGASVITQLPPKTLAQFQAIAGSQNRMLSVTYLKRYIGIQGKHITKDKAAKLAQLIEDAVAKSKIARTDPYYKRLSNVISSLGTFVKQAKKTDTLLVHEAVLNGIQETLGGCCTSCERGCGCHQQESLAGFEDGRIDYAGAGAITRQPERMPVVMNSMDFAKMKFRRLDFKGKWLDFIGDPAPGFSMMVFGRPKFGKSILCIDFAAYLARNHGKVLYVAKEEGLDATLQEKIDSPEVKHPNLTVASELLEDKIQGYDFIFLDSVNRLGLEPDDLNRLKAAYPGKSFIYIFQVTKDGNFRGANTFQHDVDVVVEVPQAGRAVQFGRFNQGGELNIFKATTAA